MDFVIISLYSYPTFALAIHSFLLIFSILLAQRKPFIFLFYNLNIPIVLYIDPYFTPIQRRHVNGPRSE